MVHFFFFRLKFSFLIFLVWFQFLNPYTAHSTQIESLNRDFKKNLLINENWNSKLDLYGSRGEVRPFIIRFTIDKKSRDDFSKCHYTLDLNWDKKKITNQLLLESFIVDWVDIKTPSYIGSEKGKYPDPLIPFDKSELDTYVKNMNFDKNLFIWHDLRILKSAEPGDYRGFFYLKCVENSHPIAALPIHLKIWPMELPDQLSLPGYTEINPWYIKKTHKDVPNQEIDQLISEYFKQLKNHHFYMFKSWRRLPKLEKNQILFNDFYLLSENTPSSTLIDFPSDFHQSLTPDEIDSSKYWKATESWIQQHKDKTYFSYYLDEPTQEDIKKAPTKLKLIKQLAPSLKILITTMPHPLLDPFVSIYSPIMNQIDLSNPPKTEKELWWYISCMSHGCDSNENNQTPDFVIDRYDSDVLAIGPLSFVSNFITTFLYFHVNYNYQFKHKNPWNDFYYFGGNGDGSLFYPGWKTKFGWKKDQPILSIRLKLWREASLLHQYLSWIKIKDPKFFNSLDLNSKFASVRNWIRNGNYYYELHDQIGERLNEL